MTALVIISGWVCKQRAENGRGRKRQGLAGLVLRVAGRRGLALWFHRKAEMKLFFPASRSMHNKGLGGLLLAIVGPLEWVATYVTF